MNTDKHGSERRAWESLNGLLFLPSHLCLSVFICGFVVIFSPIV